MNEYEFSASKYPSEPESQDHKAVETVNQLHLSCGGGPGQGAGGSGTEREGPLSTVAIARSGARRNSDLDSKARPDAEETLHIVLSRLDDMKAEDTTTIDLRTESTIADYMVVTSGRSNRHVGAVADQVLEDLRGAGLAGLRVEGMPLCDWVLIDAGDVIVHVFDAQTREYFGLEDLWADARRVDWERE